MLQMAHAAAALREGGGSGEEEEREVKEKTPENVWTARRLCVRHFSFLLHCMSSTRSPFVLILSLPLSSSQTMLKSSNISCRLVERLVERTVVGMCCVVLYQLPLT